MIRLQQIPTARLAEAKLLRLQLRISNLAYAGRRGWVKGHPETWQKDFAEEEGDNANE